jgi:hypothetical protein
MLNMSFGAREAIVTDILTLLAVKVFSVQNDRDMAKRTSRVKKCEQGNFSTMNATKKWKCIIRFCW